METFQRYLLEQVQSDLQQKMVFLGGPRQVGKTTLARQIVKKQHGGYLNWDISEDREKILKKQWPAQDLWAFDEIHKYRQWRNLLKGLYDKFHPEKKILVTGSARLDIYRRGGDSLQGRYHYLRLHPLSVGELGTKNQADFLTLLHLGGFPEPFFRGGKIEAKRWSREYRIRFIQEDIHSLERLHDLGTLELLILRLPELVGSPLSLNGLREDLQISHGTITHWIDILEKLYAIFRISPFGAPRLRAVKKEQKHYHFDWTLVSDESLRFENMVACHLLKWVHFQQDTKGQDYELQYFRDIDSREVDFVISNKRKPILAVECKWNDTDVTRSLKYLQQRFPDCVMWQVSAVGKQDYISDEKIRVAPALKFLQELV